MVLVGFDRVGLILVRFSFRWVCLGLFLVGLVWFWLVLDGLGLV